MNRKGAMSMAPFWVCLIILIILGIFNHFEIKKLYEENNNICLKLNMTVLSQSYGNYFHNEQLSCWNETTKEIKKIK